MTHGVPQGSILGPLLFIVFMNDMPLYVNSDADMYADDTTINVSSRTIEDLENKLNDDLRNVHNWCSINRMAVNAEKTKVMMITPYQKLPHLPKQTLDVKYNDTTLQNVSSEKLLGVYVDNRLSWKEHINQVAKKISKNIALLRQIRCYIPHASRITFYKCFIQPHLDYCNTIWGNGNTKRILLLQKLALRIIEEVPRRTPSSPLFKKCRVMTIKERVQYRSSCLVYKACNGLTPSYLSDMFKTMNNTTQRSTRLNKPNMLYIPRARLETTYQTLRHNGATIFNSLSQQLRDSKTLDTFKSTYIKTFFNAS